ncbi:MAG: putative zinc-binding metallopeptidase [Dysgonamonadaceae bacterium]|nr:putative zinc-binding metallopeptidase [Dysgonamonadaceae bacterium]
MKKILFYSSLFVIAITFFSCEEEKLGPSIIIDEEVSLNAAEQWYYDNFTKPFNIEVLYKLRDIDADAYDQDDGSSYGFNIVPADPAKSFALAQLIKYFWVGVFEESQGPDFIKANGFRQIQFEGTYRYKANNVYVLATASKGIRIVFCGINNLSMNNLKDAEYISDRYMRTMYHENTHILNQKKSYPAAFGNVCGPNYIGDDWNTRDDTTAYKLGFISSYAGHSSGEDFAEIVSYYVTRRAQWDAVMDWESPKINEGGGKTDVEKLTQKLGYVREYLLTAWGIDIDELRRIYEEKAADLENFNLLTY